MCYPFLDILFVFYDFLRTFFCYILIVLQGFLGTSFFDILFVVLNFPGTLLLIFYFIFWIFLVSTVFTCQLQIRILLIPSFLICSLWHSIFYRFFFLIPFYELFFILLSLFNCLSFLFWLIINFSLFSFQASLLPCKKYLLFQWTINDTPGIDSPVNFYKLHLNIQSQWVNIVINCSYIIFQWVQFMIFLKNCCTRTRYISILIFAMWIKWIYGIISSN